MSFNHYEFYKGIDVYQDVFKDVSNTLSIFKETESSTDSIFGQWDKWYEFGNILRIPKLLEPVVQNEKHKKQFETYQEIHEIFRKVTEHYIEKNNHGDFFKNNKWQIVEPSVCKYHPDLGVGYNGLAMDYHTDYQNELEGAPGWKFGFTTTMYINDDYDGGEVDFFDGENLISFKPKAGDVTVFPSGSPDIDPNNRYMHGVLLAKGNPKYFIRMHYRYWKDASEEYNEGLLKYGEAAWRDMCEEKYVEKRLIFQEANRPRHFTKRIVK
jgi:hypothetical protein